MSSCSPASRSGGSAAKTSWADALRELGKFLVGGEAAFVEVAVLLDAPDDVGRCERERMAVAVVDDVRDLLPCDRRGDAGCGRAAQGVRTHRRLVAVVLTPVDEHLAATLVARHVGGD